MSDDTERADLLQAVGYLADNFFEARLNAGRSQEDVAIAAGISVQTYSRIEGGRSAPCGDVNPTLSTLLRVYQALELPSPFSRADVGHP